MSSKMEEKLIRTAPVIAGAIYRFKDPNTGLEESGVMLTTRELPDGRTQGELKRFRLRDMVVTENSETFMGWDLVAQPLDLENPIVSERKESEMEELRRQLQEAQEALEAERTSVHTQRVVELREEGVAWAEIAKEVDIPWQTAKRLYTNARG